MHKLEISNIVDFLSEECKNKEHRKCYGKWFGLGFRVDCCCLCHKKTLIENGGLGSV